MGRRRGCFGDRKSAIASRRKTGADLVFGLLDDALAGAAHLVSELLRFGRSGDALRVVVERAPADRHEEEDVEKDHRDEQRTCSLRGTNDHARWVALHDDARKFLANAKPARLDTQ